MQFPMSAEMVNMLLIAVAIEMQYYLLSSVMCTEF